MNFTQSIQQIKAVQDPQLGNVVTEFSYVLVAEDSGKSDVCIRRIVLDQPNVNSFIPFNSLSEQDALTWAINHLGQDEIEAMKNGMSSKLEDLPANMVVDVAAPWENLVENA